MGKENESIAQRPGYKMRRGIVSPPKLRKVLKSSCVTLLDEKHFSKII